MNPVVTRKSEATRSPGSRPVRTSSPNPRATASGDGKTDGGKTCNSHSADQTAMATKRTRKGSRRALEGIGVSVMKKLFSDVASDLLRPGGPVVNSHVREGVDQTCNISSGPKGRHLPCSTIVPHLRRSTSIWKSDPRPHGRGY